MEASSSLLALPADLLARVCSFLDALALCRIGAVCTQAAEVANWAPLWCAALRRLFVFGLSPFLLQSADGFDTRTLSDRRWKRVYGLVFTVVKKEVRSRQAMLKEAWDRYRGSNNAPEKQAALNGLCQGRTLFDIYCALVSFPEDAPACAESVPASELGGPLHNCVWHMAPHTCPPHAPWRDRGDVAPPAGQCPCGAVQAWSGEEATAEVPMVAAGAQLDPVQVLVHLTLDLVWARCMVDPFDLDLGDVEAPITSTTDGAPFAPCPVCLRKLVASRAVLSARRLFEDLLAFCLKHDAAAGGAFAHEVAALRLRLRQLDGVAIPGATCERA